MVRAGDQFIVSLGGLAWGLINGLVFLSLSFATIEAVKEHYIDEAEPSSKLKV